MKAYMQSAVLVASLLTLTAAAPGTPDTEELTSPPVAAALSAGFHVELGDFLTSQRRFGAARQAYFAAVKKERADNLLPVEALRRIANAYYFEGDYQSAAATLQLLAEEAASFDDPEAQVWALADAAWLADLNNDESESQLYVKQVRRLCHRHASLADLGTEIEAKLMQDFRVFAPHLPYW